MNVVLSEQAAVRARTAVGAPRVSDVAARAVLAASACPFGSAVERYYTTLYAVDVGGTPGNDMVAYWHTNGAVVVALAPRHAIIARRLRVARVELAARHGASAAGSGGAVLGSCSESVKKLGG